MMTPLNRSKPLVARVVSRMAIGGVQRGILATLARADRDRFDFHVVCTKKEGRWADDVRAMGIPLTCQKTLPPWDPYQIARLSRLLRRLRPDLVHIHMAPMVIPVASACRLAGIRRYIIQWHSNYERFWNEQQNALLRRWERWLTRRAGAVLAVSASSARANAALMGVPLESVRIVPNGIDLAAWRAAVPVDPRPGWGLPDDAPLVVQVARYLGTKRNEDFIEAAAIVLRHWPGDRPRPAFALIGSGADAFRRGYEDLIRRHGVGGNVILAGSRDDVPGLLKCCQMGVLTSENEGFGQVILEYLAAGLPVVATNIPSVAEMTRDGKAALLMPPRRPDLLAEGMRRLLLEQELGRELVEAGRQVLGRFDWGAAAAAYEEIYDSVLSETRAIDKSST
jgi:glycosyltransferase involved in cell wall biosynthesis